MGAYTKQGPDSQTSGVELSRGGSLGRQLSKTRSLGNGQKPHVIWNRFVTDQRAKGLDCFFFFLPKHLILPEQSFLAQTQNSAVKKKKNPLRCTDGLYEMITTYFTWLLNLSESTGRWRQPSPLTARRSLGGPAQRRARGCTKRPRCSPHLRPTRGCRRPSTAPGCTGRRSEGKNSHNKACKMLGKRGEETRRNAAAGQRRLLGLRPITRTHLTVQLPWWMIIACAEVSSALGLSKWK